MPSPISVRERKIYGGIFDYDVKANRLDEVNGLLEDPDVWNNPKRAQDLGKEKKALEAVVQTLGKLTEDLNGADELFELAREEGDDETLESIEADVKGFEAIVADMEFRRMFSGEMDQANAFIDIQAGAGGTEACDWA